MSPIIPPTRGAFSDYLSYHFGQVYANEPLFRGVVDSEPWFVPVAERRDPASGHYLYLGPGAASTNEVVHDRRDVELLSVFEEGFWEAPTRPTKSPKLGDDLTAICKYCKGPLLKEEVELPAVPPRGLLTAFNKRNCAVVLHCQHCGWWKLYKYHGGHQSGIDGGIAHANRLYIFEGVVWDFHLDANIKAIRALRERIREKQIDLRAISPTELERLVGAILADLYGCTVHHVGGPGDGGIDLLVGVGGRKPIAVQVKRRASATATEGVSLVRHFLGSMLLENIPRGIVVSTAKDFTAPAKDVAAKAAKLFPVQIDLYNYDKLMELLELSRNTDGRPWLPFLKPPRLRDRLALKAEAFRWKWRNSDG